MTRTCHENDIRNSDLADLPLAHFLPGMHDVWGNCMWSLLVSSPVDLETLSSHPSGREPEDMLATMSRRRTRGSSSWLTLEPGLRLLPPPPFSAFALFFFFLSLSLSLFSLLQRCHIKGKGERRKGGREVGLSLWRNLSHDHETKKVISAVFSRHLLQQRTEIYKFTNFIHA